MNDPSAEDDNNNMSTSIGDVVQNLHGGKYQFSDAGNSFVGQQFAESLYSGGSGQVYEVDDNDDDDAKWVLLLQDMSEQSTKPILDTLLFDKENTVHTISIQNEERSWEKYYAFLLPKNDVKDDDASYYKLSSPKGGSLAPRGGASNVCDPSQPYSDSSAITIEWIGGEWTDNCVAENMRLLVVGTEAKVWRYACLRN